MRPKPAWSDESRTRWRSAASSVLRYLYGKRKRREEGVDAWGGTQEKGNRMGNCAGKARELQGPTLQKTLRRCYYGSVGCSSGHST